jgi:uncharacterized membrane protein YdjX (TVP38/TMEM64 family)
MNIWIKRLLPIGVIVLMMMIVFATGWYKALSFDALRLKHQALTHFVQLHPYSTPLIFIAVYILATALSVPGGIFLSLIGGFLFLQPWSTLYVVIGATTGAMCIFLAARTALGDAIFKKAGSRLDKMKEGFKENAASYLLFLRFVPLFPFWLVNLAAAFFHVKLTTFLWTTAVGILPGVFVFTQAGRGLGAIFETNEPFSVKAVFNIQVVIALVALGIFSLVPILIKKWKKHDR